jgi:hypothetical protein
MGQELVADSLGHVGRAAGQACSLYRLLAECSRAAAAWGHAAKSAMLRSPAG